MGRKPATKKVTRGRPKKVQTGNVKPKLESKTKVTQKAKADTTVLESVEEISIVGQIDLKQKVLKDFQDLVKKTQAELELPEVKFTSKSEFDPVFVFGFRSFIPEGWEEVSVDDASHVCWFGKPMFFDIVKNNIVLNMNWIFGLHYTTREVTFTPKELLILGGKFVKKV